MSNVNQAAKEFRALKGKPVVRTVLEKDTETAQYVVWDPETKDGLIIDSVLNFDPVAGKASHKSAQELLDVVRSEGINVVKIIETHAHADHLTAAQYLKQQLGGSVPVCIGEGIKHVQEVFAPMFQMEGVVSTEDFDHLFTDGESYTLGNIECEVFASPGHTPACMVHRIGDAIFTGDTIFMPDVGSARCDFPKGSAEMLYGSIQKIFSLPPHTRVFVGHDYPPEGRKHTFETTVSAQTTANKHINASTPLDDFVSWRRGRDDTLKPPRLILPSLQVNIRAGRLPMEGGKVMLRIPVTVDDHAANL
ncbi:beta-lactamase-like protein [Gonapodya prolifera JEL478]|uniref:Beta-lactamase-like protein n=1 Tax=Gonapodya prolifera (strain JEL478) TaxID=1344416 RepID=A0A138ZY71_GONPJ|nr:beta-lactamase-like protein [Gonapodya prolifera JEL478]|eukprot:KXS09446.1 beta-lactamase-like protein [Gonapodya prolifera JEL478]